MLDEPTNHLDLEATTTLNKRLMAFPEVVLFSSHDHQFVSTVATPRMDLTLDGLAELPADPEAYPWQAAAA